MMLRSLLLSAAVLLAAGCATTHTGRVASPGADCPMNFTLYCETTRPGPAHTPTACRCIRHKDINVMLHGEY
jgi:hypothetical protein